MRDDVLWLSWFDKESPNHNKKKEKNSQFNFDLKHWIMWFKNPLVLITDGSS